MKCPGCGETLTKVVTDSRGNGLDAGDVIITKALTAIRQDGTLVIKCPGCKQMVPLRRVPVFKILVGAGAGKIGQEERDARRD